MTKEDFIKQDIPNIFPEGFIETIENDPRLKYADTDSSYNSTRLPFNKYGNNEAAVEYTQAMARDFNIKYLDILNGLLADKVNLDPEFNFMKFKSEVVAYRGFFKAKKFYALAKIWDEGTFFPELKLKKTGGQILKADSSKITFNMLTEVYNLLVLNTTIRNIMQLKTMIYKDIKNKYTKILMEALDKFDFSQFSIPKKWPLGETKTIPMHVKAAMFYNLLIQDLLRPGDSFFILQIKINPNLLYKFITNNPDKINSSNFTLDIKEINNKLNLIAIPSDIKEENIDKLKRLFHELDIQPDIDKIREFNIDMKLEQFSELFDAPVLNTRSLGGVS